MWSGPIRCSPPPSRSTPVDREHVGADAVDLRAQLRRGSAHRSWTCGSLAAFDDHGLALGQHGRHQRVLGGRHRRLVEEDGAARAAGAPSARSVPFRSTSAPSSREGVKVRVEAAAADDVAAGRRHDRAARSARAAARRAGTTRGSRGTAPGRASVFVHARRVDSAPRWAPSTSASAPRSASSSSIVSTSRMRGTFSSATGSSVSRRRREDRQRGVLVAGRADGAGERATALDRRTTACRRPVIVPSRQWQVTRDHGLGDAHAATRRASRCSRHALAVEASIRFYARLLGEDEEFWGRDGSAPRLRLRDPPDARPASTGRGADPAGRGLPRGADRGRSCHTPSTWS